MDNAARARQRMLALSFLLPPCCIGAEGLTPKGLDQVVQTRATAFKVLPIAAAHPAQLYVAGSLALLALGALAVSYAAIAALVRDRGSAVATVAALIGGLGAFCGASSMSWSIPASPPWRRRTCHKTRLRGSW